MRFRQFFQVGSEKRSQPVRSTPRRWLNVEQLEDRRLLTAVVNTPATYEEALYKAENLYLRELLALADSQEGIKAQLEDRKPEWRDL